MASRTPRESSRQAVARGREVEPRLDVRLGVSACLLGHEVRVDGGHKRNRFLVQELGAHVTYVPVCPEVEMGMSTPRPPLRLVRGDTPPGTGAGRRRGEPFAPFRLVVRESDQDVTPAMRDWASGRLDGLETSYLDGYVLKKDSPTCGLFKVKVYDHNGSPSPLGVGVWAEALTTRFPHLPVEEEGRLNDPVLRESFVLRTFTHARWRRFVAEDHSPAGLVRFHTAHKLTILAHHPTIYRELGRLVATAGAGSFEEVTQAYAAGLTEALHRRASRGRHVNVMQHLAGFVKDELGPEDKRELDAVLQDYRTGLVPIIVPLTLLRHLLRRHARNEWVTKQTYLAPYPAELMLRNTI